MRSMKAVESSKARFSERKELAILNEPLESSGTLIYRAPDRLEKHTLVPERASMVLEGDRLARMAQAARSLGRPDAAEAVADLVQSAARERR